jgi:hypothetical protein
VRADETAFALGISEVRKWVKTNRTEKRADDIAEAIERLGIRAAEPYSVLAINALDDGPPPLDPSVSLDWVDHFSGDEARNRRGLKNPDEWEVTLRPQLIDAQRRLRALGARRVLITGTMRLPTWFTAAVIFQETAGFTPAKIKDRELWAKPTSRVDPVPLTLNPPVADLTRGSDVALALAISCDPTVDVARHLSASGRNMPIITASLRGGTSNTSITDGRHAYAVALAVRDLAREIARTVNPPVLHLFLAVPAGLAVLLGGVWDRVPTTQTYEDLAARGYEPAFIIPN